MKKILILGAGMSSSSLIKYLLDHSIDLKLKITVTALNIEDAKSKINNHKNAIAKKFDINNLKELQNLICENDIIVSLLPAKFHNMVAQECLKQNKHLFTTSYVSPEMKQMDKEAKKKNLLFFNECGVDPGIDHMSAMKIIDEIKNNGGLIKSFESNTGGLIAPEFDNNPWNYKFTWNARNVILAGQSGAKYLRNKKTKFIPYNQLFKRTHTISVLNYGKFEVYANRDSVSYKNVYGLNDIETLYRGTLRKPGYCKAYDCFVQLGLTNDSIIIENSEKITYKEFVEIFLPHRNNCSVEDNFCKTLKIHKNSDVFKKIKWLNIFSNKKIELKNATPAQILQSIIEPKWKLEENDLDMIVMQHRFEYLLKGKLRERKSSLIVIGKNKIHTAMAITVGTPLAIAIKLFITNIINAKGVVIPVKPDIYIPILQELENHGITFVENDRILKK